MKTAIDKNESEVSKMKREALEWIERHGRSSPPFMSVAINAFPEKQMDKEEMPVMPEDEKKYTIVMLRNVFFTGFKSGGAGLSYDKAEKWFDRTFKVTNKKKPKLQGPKIAKESHSPVSVESKVTDEDIENAAKEYVRNLYYPIARSKSEAKKLVVNFAKAIRDGKIYISPK